MGQSITTNPILISIINMTVVFAVLYGLSLIIRLITIIDPTQKKKIAPEFESSNKAIVVSEEDYDEMIILFTAAIAAYGYSGARIAAIRPIGSATWSQAARMEGASSRDRMF